MYVNCRKLGSEFYGQMDEISYYVWMQSGIDFAVMVPKSGLSYSNRIEAF
jgi:hypothetical protein